MAQIFDTRILPSPGRIFGRMLRSFSITVFGDQSGARAVVQRFSSSVSVGPTPRLMRPVLTVRRTLAGVHLDLPLAGTALAGCALHAVDRTRNRDHGVTSNFGPPGKSTLTT
jgi:hypothetical protein